jgi:hypothetical protein
LWKRNLVGILDFLLASIGFGYLLFKLGLGTPAAPPPWLAPGSTTVGFNLGPWASLLLLVLVVGYFVILGRTGGTVFQRLFRMKRARATTSQPASTA